MRNPYSMGSVVSQSNFYGREDLVEHLLDRDRHCIYLKGNRRIGKTSVLKQLEHETLGMAFFLSIQKSGWKMVELGRELIQEVRRKIDRYPLLQDLDLDSAKNICDVIETLAAAAEKNQTEILLLFDEAEDLMNLSASELGRLRGAMQDKVYLRTILAASKRLEELNGKKYSGNTSPFLHGFEPVYISSLGDQAAHDLICQVKHTDGPVEVSDELLVEIMKYTGNHPFLMQRVCQDLFEPSPPRRLRPFTKDDLIVRNEMEVLFQNDYEALSLPEQAVMKQVAEEGPVSEESMELLRRDIVVLRELGFISRAENGYKIANHFLRTWLKAQIGETMTIISELPPTVQLEGRDITLTQPEFELLTYLYDHRGHVCSKKELIQFVYKKHEYIPKYDDPMLQTLVSRVRAKTEPPRFIIMVRGDGYKFIDHKEQ